MVDGINWRKRGRAGPALVPDRLLIVRAGIIAVSSSVVDNSATV